MMIYTNALLLFIIEHIQNGVFEHNLCLIQ